MDPSPYGSEAPKAFATKRFKFVWRILMISNLALGAYMFAKARNKEMAVVERKRPKHGAVNSESTKSVKVEEEEIAKTGKTASMEGADIEKEDINVVSEPSLLSEFIAATEESTYPAVTIEPVKVARKPILEDDQRELFKWMLEEKRKIEPEDWEEKKRIDRDKGILKDFIRAEKIPKLLEDDCCDSCLRDWDKFFSR